MKNNLIAYSHDIYALDSGYLRSQLVAVHLIVHQGRVALIDTCLLYTSDAADE